MKNQYILFVNLNSPSLPYSTICQRREVKRAGDLLGVTESKTLLPSNVSQSSRRAGGYTLHYAKQLRGSQALSSNQPRSELCSMFASAVSLSPGAGDGFQGQRSADWPRASFISCTPPSTHIPHSRDWRRQSRLCVCAVWQEGV